MKTPRTIQTKRTRPKSGFRMLHAATRASKKRKQRAATSAAPEDLGEVPGVGVPLALVVILLLHVAAIAGIWIHDQWSESADLEATKTGLKEDVQPARIAELDFHLVSAGDDIDSIALEYGVDREAIIKVNEGISDYQAGWKINLPPRRLEGATPSESLVGGNSSTETNRYPPQEHPLIQTTDDQILPGGRSGDLVAVGDSSTETERTEEAVLIRPVPPVPNDRVMPRTPPGQVGTKTHIIKSGDTLYGISLKNKVSVADLERANPGIKPSALKIGATLKIPAR